LLQRLRVPFWDASQPRLVLHLPFVSTASPAPEQQVAQCHDQLRHGCEGVLMKVRYALLVSAFLAAASAHATTPIATTVSANGGYVGSLAVLNDGVYPPNGQFYQTDTVSNFGNTQFTFDFGGLTSVGSFNLTVDNNDDYFVSFFDGATQIGTSKIVPGASGTVNGGVETFASDPSLQGTYLPTLAIAGNGIQATSARIFATGGDSLYSIGEVAFFAPSAGDSAVPEPSTWALMLFGFGAIGAAMRKSHQTRRLNHVFA
jgi:hypothetical protein